MSVPQILLTLFLKPAELFYETACTFFVRLTGSAGAGILCLSLTVCLLATPLRVREWKDCRADIRRTLFRLLFQAACFAASWRWFSGVQAFRGVSFGPVPDLGHPYGLVLFWAGYTVFAIARGFTGLGYRPMELNARQRKTDRNNRIQLLCCGLFMAALTGLFIPSAVIGSSPAEFADVHYYRDPARYLLSSGLTAAGTFLVWGMAYGWLMAPRARKRYAFLMTVLSVVSMLNYMFFGTGYGFLSSELRYETTIFAGAGPILAGLAVVASAAALVLLLRRKEPLVLRLICLFGCAALAVVSVINVGTIRTAAGELEKSAGRQTGEKASFELDRQGKNVVVIMLDRAISGFVPYIMNEKPELQAQFEGFTWYPNTLSYGYHTNIAAPALYGGYEYNPDGLAERSELTLREKHNEALKIMPLNFLDAGFEVTVCDAPYANYQWVPDMSIYDGSPEIRTYNTIGSYNDFKIQTLDELDAVRNRNFFCYSLFRCATPALQKAVYDDGNYLKADVSGDGVEGFELLGVSADFLNSYMVMKNLPAMTETTDRGQNTFLMLTNEMTHNVIHLQEPDYAPSRRVDNAAYEAENGIRRTADGKELDLPAASDLVRIHYESDMSAFILLGEWFDRLREEGVYDNTRIILVSDHGCYLGLFGASMADKYPELSASGLYEPEQWTDTMCYNPLLMVKDFGAAGFTTDESFMINADTPLLAFDGLVPDPVNPFTGKRITGEEKNREEQHLVESDWAISRNDGTFFSDPVRITFRGRDVFNLDNWSVELSENTENP